MLRYPEEEEGKKTKCLFSGILGDSRACDGRKWLFHNFRNFPAPRTRSSRGKGDRRLVDPLK